MKIESSIIMGVYNGSKYVGRAIESIINQTYKEWEFIICDDCSTDNTVDILEQYAQKDTRIKIIKNGTNLGLAASLNKCIDEARGKYIVRQDDDDLSKPTRLEKQINFLKYNKEYALVGSNAHLINNKNLQWGIWSNREKPIKDDLIKGVCFIHPTVVIRKDILNELKGYDEKALRVEDYDLWFRLYAKGQKGYNLQECLVDYTLDTDSYGKRKYIYRINEFKVRKNGYKINNMSKKCYIYAIKPLVIGLIPAKLMSKFHNVKFK